MKKKKIIVSLFSIFLYLTSFSQNDSNNNNIKYGTLIKSSQFLDSNKFEPRRVYVVVDITPSLRNAISKFTYEKWMELLNDTTTDWTANLCLYNMFEKKLNSLACGIQGKSG